MKRSQAEKLIDRIREIAAKPTADIALIRALEDAGIGPLVKCEGEAHSNPFIDNCMTCAPRWGFVGKAVKVR